MGRPKLNRKNFAVIHLVVKGYRPSELAILFNMSRSQIAHTVERHWREYLAAVDKIIPSTMLGYMENENIKSRAALTVKKDK
jgi:hypothetical protein